MNGYEQAVNLIQKSGNIGLVLQEKPSPGEAASLLAVSRVLGRLKKKVGVLFAGEWPGPVKDFFSLDEFIPEEDRGPQNFVISVNCANSPVKELRYERVGDLLNIILDPRDRLIKKEDISLGSRPGQYDLLIVFGATRLEDLGKIFEESPGVFYEKPVIAIASAVGDEAFGEVNLTDAAKSSVAEITAELIKKLAAGELDAHSATALLFGLIYKTRNFQNGRTKPSTLAVAAELIGLGAKKDEIVRALWKTKPLPLLQLWGRAAVRSRLDQAGRALWSVLTKEDFLKTGTVPDEALRFVLERMEEHFSLPGKFILLWQNPENNAVRALVKNPLDEAERKGFRPWPPKEGYLEPAESFASFQEAEETIRRILAEN